VEVEYTPDARAYRNARYLDILTKIEVGTYYKDRLLQYSENEDAVMRASILLDGMLTENEKIRFTESW
jgi:hypothetical protein